MQQKLQMFNSVIRIKSENDDFNNFNDHKNMNIKPTFEFRMTFVSQFFYIIHKNGMIFFNTSTTKYILFFNYIQ